MKIGTGFHRAFMVTQKGLKRHVGMQIFFLLSYDFFTFCFQYKALYFKDLSNQMYLIFVTLFFRNLGTILIQKTLGLVFLFINLIFLRLLLIYLCSSCNLHFYKRCTNLSWFDLNPHFNSLFFHPVSAASITLHDLQLLNHKFQHILKQKGINNALSLGFLLL